MKNKHNLNSTAIIQALQNDPNLSYSDLGKKFNCTKNNIYYFMRKNKLISIKEGLQSFVKEIEEEKFKDDNLFLKKLEKLEQRIEQLEKKSKFSFFNIFNLFRK